MRFPDEARALLRARLETYLPWSYAALSERVGVEDVVRETGPSGREYVLEVSVEILQEGESGLEILGYASEAGGRFLFPSTVSLSFTLQPQGSPTLQGDWPTSAS